MKFKHYSRFIVLLIAISIIFSACGKSEKDEKETISNSETQSSNINTSEISSVGTTNPVTHESTAAVENTTVQPTTKARKSVSITIPE